jgi:hypothetical protein
MFGKRLRELYTSFFVSNGQLSASARLRIWAFPPAPKPSRTQTVGSAPGARMLPRGCTGGRAFGARHRFCARDIASPSESVSRYPSSVLMRSTTVFVSSSTAAGAVSSSESSNGRAAPHSKSWLCNTERSRGGSTRPCSMSRAQMYSSPCCGRIVPFSLRLFRYARFVIQSDASCSGPSGRFGTS